MKSLALLCSIVLGACALAQIGSTNRVSIGWPLPPNADIDRIDVSNTGRYVVYETTATNIVGNDINGARDIFLYDMATGITEIISVFDVFGDANGDSFRADVPSNGRYVVFQSAATNLVANDTNGVSDVFVRDRQTRTTFRVSVSTGGIQGNGASTSPAISDDGNFVVFLSAATNLVAGDTNAETDAFLYDLNTGTTTRVSVTNAGVQANDATTDVAVDGQGERIVFSSSATNLVAGDTNSAIDVFMRDTQLSTTQLLSRSTGGTIGNGISRSPSIDYFGNRVTFRSAASNLVAGDTNGVDDTFMRQLGNSSTVRVSTSSSGIQGNSASIGGAVHPLLDFVAFQSNATNLVSGDSNGVSDVFYKNITTGQLTRQSLSTAGVQANGSSSAPVVATDLLVFLSGASNLVSGDTNGFIDGFGRYPNSPFTLRVTNTGLDGDDLSAESDISKSGRYIVFSSPATNLVAGDTGFTDIFRIDLYGDLMTRASLTDTEGQANSHSFDPSVSDDGRYVAFASAANNLVAGDTNAQQDIFVRDVQGSSTRRVSVSSGGAQANDDSQTPAISANGRYVTFESTASNLVVGDTNGVSDVFVHDLQTSQTTRVSVSSSEQQGANSSTDAAISDDGTFVAFVSFSSNLVAGDNNSRADAFVRNISGGTTELVSVSSSGVQADDHTLELDISGDGTKVSFNTPATNLVAGDTNNHHDVFVRNRSNNTTVRVSISTSGMQGNQRSYGSAISSDGMSIVFRSDATNLVLGDTNGTGDCFVRSTALNITRRVTVSTAGNQNNSATSYPTINGDGLAVAFATPGALSDLDRNDYEDVYLNDARILSNTLTPIRGVVESGSQGSVQYPDDIYYTLRPGITFTTAQAPIEFVTEAVGPLLNPTRVEFAIEFHSTAPAIRQTVEMFNFDTNAYEVVDTRASTVSDSVAVTAITSNVGRFVNASGLMRSRVSYKASGPVFAYPWRSRIDHIRWTQFN